MTITKRINSALLSVGVLIFTVSLVDAQTGTPIRERAVENQRVGSQPGTQNIRTTTVKSSKSNTSDRMGGGGGKGDTIGSQKAQKTNQPIITKDVDNITQTIPTSGGNKKKK